MGWSPAGDEGNGGQGMESLAVGAAVRDCSPIPLLQAVHGASVYGRTTATQMVQLHPDVSSDPKL